MAAGDIEIENLSLRDKKALTKSLVKQDCEFREKMREIVKDFPAMRNEVGGENFDKTIGKQLFDYMQESKAELEEDSKEEIVEGFTKFLKNKVGPPDEENNGR